MAAADATLALPRIDLRKTALLLDVDGTLLDIASEPNAVRSAPSLVANLTRLRQRCDGAIAFVSGRRLDNLDAIFAPLKLTAVGCHGAEFREPDGTVTQAEPLPATLKARLIAVAEIDPAIAIEDKDYSLAFHYRRAPQLETPLLEAVWAHRRELEAAGLGVLHGKCVVEIKRKQLNKGTAIRRLMRLEPFAGRIPVFAGDDRTDEDVFIMLPEFRGIGISVGRRMAGADCMVDQPRDIRHWLGHLAEQP